MTSSHHVSNLPVSNQLRPLNVHRKRSAASMTDEDTECSDSTRTSLNLSPLQPATPTSTESDKPMAQRSHVHSGGFQPRRQHPYCTTESLTAPDQIPAFMGDYNDARDPFPELNNAFTALDSRDLSTAAHTFNQEWLSPEALVEFLVTPTTSQERTLPSNDLQAAAIQNAGSPTALASIPLQHVPHIPFSGPPWSLQEDLFGDIDDFVAPDPGATEAIGRLLADLKPDDDIPKEQREQTPRAMSSQLMEHQKLALRWLMDMEATDKKGSLLADEMGLGKTVEAIALILARPSQDPARKTTLVVAPVALMRQWEKELKHHVRPAHRLTIHIYHGIGKRADFNKLKKFDIVLTTYGALQTEMKAIDMHKMTKLALIGPECLWYRVILDEAQAIKNPKSIQSRASAEFRSRHRLAMTGTPMMNSIDELYPIIRFLQIRPYNDQGRFGYDIAKPIKTTDENLRDKGIKRVQALLKTMMLRRELDTVIDGEPIGKIPPKHVHLDNVEFSGDEYALYKALETKSQLTFNKYLKKGTVMNNYANMLVLLLRLRQACCHPSLIKDLGVQAATEGISEDDLLERAQELAPDVVDRLKNQQGFECPICYDATKNATIFVPCGHACCGDCFQKLLGLARNIGEGQGEGGNSAKCPHCRGPLNKDRITDYLHFCKVFCPDNLDQFDLHSDHSSCSENKTEDESEGDDLDGFIVPDDFSDKDNASSSDRDQQSNEDHAIRRSKGKGKAVAKPKVTLAQLKKESLRSAVARRRYLRRLRRTFTSSAKIDKTVEILAEIEAKDPTEKVLIFSQWTSLLDLLEVALENEGMNYQRYDGSMKMDERDKAVTKFMDDENLKIMLLSLKAGNAGLNLSRASRVIILDPFWNPYVELQAEGRAHRMPQHREVHVHRVLVPQTVEDRICQLQDKKRELVSAALDEEASRNLTRLGLGELRYLFGVGPRPN